MSLRGYTILLPAALVLASTLAGQPDPIYDCRRRAAVETNTSLNGIHAKQRGGLDNGNVVLLWEAKLANGRTVNGFCEASSQTGRIVRLGIDQPDRESINRGYRITPDEAQRICQREARARFSPGNGELGARWLPNTSTKDTYRLQWRMDSAGSRIRSGWCEVDSATGHIRKFHANDGWYW